MPCMWLQHNKRQIFLDVAIIRPDDLHAGAGTLTASAPKSFKALLDTGATATCITKNVADLVGLLPIGKVPIHGVSGLSYHNNYLFYVGFQVARNDFADLPGQVMETHVADVYVQGAELIIPGGEFDVLLGMDILSTGSLAVEGSGTFSFSF
jgi:Aspartyl protease